MASNRTTLDLNFVALVLNVNGRLRPDDLQSIPAVQRASLLQAYFDAYHTTEPLYLDGDVLVRGSAPPGAAQPAPQFPATPPPASLTPDPAIAGAAGPSAAPAFPAPAPSAFPAAAEPSAYSSAAPAAAAAVAPAAALAAAASFAAPATSAPPIGGDFFAIPAPASQPSSFFDGDPGAVSPQTPSAEPVGAPTASPDGKASVLFWLLPVLLTWVGGLIAFFVVRGKNAKQAKAMLITGIVLTVVYVLIGVAAFFGLGLMAGSSLQPKPTAVSSSAKPSVATDYPKWKVVADHGVVSATPPATSEQNLGVRQDHALDLRSPDGKVAITAWYARSGADMASVHAKSWTTPDTLFKGTDGSGAIGRALVAAMKHDHPKELLLGAYKAGPSKGAEQTYDVGFATPGSSVSGSTWTHGEHVYTYSAHGGWKQTASGSTSTSAWNTTGAVS